MNRIRTAVLLHVALVCAALSGCSTPVPPESAAAAPSMPNAQPRSGVPEQFQAATPAAPVSAETRATSMGQAASTALPDHMDPASTISRERSVFFAFDDSNVAAQYMPVVELHAKYLGANANLAVRIEGHADERGGPEYNLALGQRRAEAVAQALRLLGVTGPRVEAVSYGEERPQATGHSEADWARNRRADIAYPRR